MASPICKGCDLYKPQVDRLRDRECAAFFTCTESDCCGARSPALRSERESTEKTVAAVNRVPGVLPIRLGSLFDGSGGFPLAGVLNGIVPLGEKEAGQLGAT